MVKERVQESKSRSKSVRSVRSKASVTKSSNFVNRINTERSSFTGCPQFQSRYNLKTSGVFDSLRGDHMNDKENKYLSKKRSIRIISDLKMENANKKKRIINLIKL